MPFADYFYSATGNKPFPWQSALYKEFSKGKFPQTASIPTGLGKTSIVAIWLIALALHPNRTPRRLVYVVNRRTVVDQTTAEVEMLRNALTEEPELEEISDRLRDLCALPLPSDDASPLAISTLRGQFADNREWSADPTRPAVIIGTVDMIGSGLVFQRYTVGFKLRPHHAAFLGQDALLVHDEAHLEPAFQKLLNHIVTIQKQSNDQRKLQVIELTATTRSETESELFGITEDDKKNKVVRKRIKAVKHLTLHPVEEKEECKKITALALAQKDSGKAVLVFVRTVAHATKIASELEKKTGKNKVRTLTGTMRGKERDELIEEPIFKRFLSKNKPNISKDGTVFLVATSAGENGVNISTSDLICDLSTFESMAQRFGRVNRFGEFKNSTIMVVYPSPFSHAEKIEKAKKAVDAGGKKAEKDLCVLESKLAMEIARERTLALLMELGNDASPAALDQLSVTERTSAFSPPPRMREATTIQFDAWALTSIRTPIAARPPVTPYLHGEAEWQPPETQVVWRHELDVIHGANLIAAYSPDELLEDFPIKPHELLRDTSKRIAAALSDRIGHFLQEKQHNGESPSLHPAWFIHDNGTIEIYDLVPAEFLDAYKKGKGRNDKEKKVIKRHKEHLEEFLAHGTLILPSSFGGISEQGFFKDDARDNDHKSDVAEIAKTRFRMFHSSMDIPDKYAEGFRLIRTIDTEKGKDEPLNSPTRYWLWLEAAKTLNGEKRFSTAPEPLVFHSNAVQANVAAITAKLFPTTFSTGQPNIPACLTASGEGHDTGKDRRPWQQQIGNTRYEPDKPETILAKSGGSMRSRHITQNYRHEFGSIQTILAGTSNSPTASLLAPFSAVERDLILHSIAAHHGRARPHFSTAEILDNNFTVDENLASAAEVPLRYARMQHRFGRWGLAWLESILRAADYAASAGIIADVDEEVTVHPRQDGVKDKVAIKAEKQTVSLRVNPANPGHYFACCGLFELAACLYPDVFAHFEQQENNQWWFILSKNKENSSLWLFTDFLQEIVKAEIRELTPDDKAKGVIQICEPFNLILDWWRYEERSIGKLKTWAGQMSVCSIAKDMQQALKAEITENQNEINKILFMSSIKTAGQPYYFNADYAGNAQAQDVGFSIDKLTKGGVKIKTASVPAVELLCLVGLQRARPQLAVCEKNKERLYDYRGRWPPKTGQYGKL